MYPLVEARAILGPHRQPQGAAVGTRDARAIETKKAQEAARARAGSTPRKDVFTSHGNDFLRDHLKKPEEQGPDAGALDAAMEQDGPQTVMTERKAIQEVIAEMAHLQNRPSLLGEIVQTGRHEDQATRLIRYLAEEALDIPVIEALSTATLDQLTVGMVIQSDAIRAIESQGPEVRELGFAGAVLWQVVSEALEHSGPSQEGVESEEEGEVDTSRASQALQTVISMLRLAVSGTV